MKKRIYFKVVSIIICSFMIMFSVISCKENAPMESSSEITEPETTENVSKEPVNMDGYEFIYANLWGFPKEGSGLSADLFYERIDQVMSEYNCNITLKQIPVEPNTFYEELNTAVMSGDKYADIIHLDFGRFQDLYRSGVIQPFSQIEGFDYTQEKFHKNVAEATLRFGEIYGIQHENPPTVGVVVIFNKSLLQREGFDIPYDLVRSKKWTWDVFREYVIGLTQDKNDDGINEIWGMATLEWAANNFEKPFAWSNNGRIVKQEENGNMRFAMGDEDFQEALTYLNDLVYINKTLAPPPIDPWVSIEDFIDGKVAFLINTPSNHYLDMEDDWGILPLPMGPKADDYVSLSVGGASLNVMPITNPDPLKSAIIYDAISEPHTGSVYDDRQAWLDDFEFNQLRDNDSREMYELLMDRTQFDLSWGMQAAVSPVTEAIYNVVRRGSATPRSAIDSISGQLEGFIDEFFFQGDYKKD